MITHIGLHSGNWRTCSPWYGEGSLSLFGILLHFSSQCSWYWIPCSSIRCSRMLSQVLNHIGRMWCLNRWICIPRQHSLDHYLALIWAFSAPNGLCSSITESKHIKAVKEPWCHSSHFVALGQMLVTNLWLDKLAASHVDFTKCSMLKGTILESVLASLSICLSITIFYDAESLP